MLPWELISSFFLQTHVTSSSLEVAQSEAMEQGTPPSVHIGGASRHACCVLFVGEVEGCRKEMQSAGMTSSVFLGTKS